MSDPLEPLDLYIAHLYELSQSNVSLLEVWDVIDRLLQIRHEMKIPEFVLDGDAFTKAVKEAKDEK